MKFSEQDYHFMQITIRLAKSALGFTGINPAVGAVIVKDGRIISQGKTGNLGSPHAEFIAIQNARKEDLSGATLYVTLEPCFHYGKNPACVDLILNSEIKRVVIANIDPDVRVNHKSVEKLRENNIEVETEFMKDEALEIIKGFIKNRSHNLPYVTAKVASSMDGAITFANSESKWITNSHARKYGHMLRLRSDAIMVGINSVIADNPLLNCRIAGVSDKYLIRIVIDTNLRIPMDARLVKTIDHNLPLWIVIAGDSNIDLDKAKELENLGVKIIRVKRREVIKVKETEETIDRIKHINSAKRQRGRAKKSGW